MGLDIHHMNPVKATDKTLAAIERLRADVGIDQKPLREFEFTDADVEHAIKWSLNDISREANPRDITADNIRDIFKTCI
jgi:alcohol dehydrogenase class IV